MTNIIFTDGASAKSINPWNLEDRPEAWTWLTNAPQSELDAMYYKVAASFRAVNKRAIAASNVPFQIKRGKQVVDDSTAWTNAVKFLPKPKELLRRISLSQTFTNKAYLLRGKDVLNNTKGLNFLVPTTVFEITDPVTGQLDYFERRVNAMTERYQPNDPNLIKLWVLDHMTELLPSKNTAAQAIFNSVGEIYFADVFIKSFYERGGVKQHVLAVKGAIWKESKEEIERGWSKFLRGWTRFASKILNADQMDIKPIGAGVDDLKNNEVYRQAIENIALGVGMPVSELLSDFDSYATAQVDRMSWLRDDIFPHVEAIAEDLNIQVFAPLGLHLDFLTETSDAETQDEVDRAKAYEIYVGAGVLPSVAAQMVGIELPEGVEYAALDKMQEEKKKEEQAKADAALEKEKLAAGKPVPPKPIKAHETSAMIALRIPDVIRDEIKKRYDFVDQETLDNLHITLVYLGDNRTIDKLDVVRAVSDLGMFQSPIQGQLQGLARFVSGGNTDPLVMTYDSPQMPKLYGMLCSVLDNYRVPYHRDYGFIPHMTLAYIPSDAQMPIDTIDPIEITFNQVYYVDGNVWYPVDLVGYDNKSAKSTKLSLDELEELRLWRSVALMKLRQGKSLDWEYKPEHGGLPDDLAASIHTALKRATNADEVKAAFEIQPPAETSAPVPEYKTSDLMKLADALNKFADASFGANAKQSMGTPIITVNTPPINITAQMPEAGTPSVTFSPVIQPSEVAVTVTNEVNPTPVTVENEVTVQPAGVTIREAPEKKKVKVDIKRDRDGKISSAEGKIE